MQDFDDSSSSLLIRCISVRVVSPVCIDIVESARDISQVKPHWPHQSHCLLQHSSEGRQTGRHHHHHHTHEPHKPHKITNQLIPKFHPPPPFHLHNINKSSILPSSVKIRIAQWSSRTKIPTAVRSLLARDPEFEYALEH